MRYLLTLLLLFATSVQAWEYTLDDFSTSSWGTSSGWGSCNAYSSYRPCISNGSYFDVNSGDVVFSYSSANIYEVIDVSDMSYSYDSSKTYFISFDAMVGPRNSEQGNKTEELSVTIYYKKSDSSIIGSESFSQSINNTSMETFEFVLSDTFLSQSDLDNIQIVISGRDNGYWNGNYGMVLANGSVSITDYDPTASAPTTTTTTGISGGITTTQSSSRSSARTRASTYNSNSDNSVYIDQAGDNNTVTITQQGTAGNHVRGIDGASAGVITGDSNTLDLKQGASTSTGINLIELSVIGSTNDILLYQDRWDDGSQDTSAGGGHTISLDLLGNLNTIDVIQRNNAGNNGNYLGIDLVGNSNNISVIQRSDAGVTAFIDVTGDNNLVDLTQDYTAGGGNHFADITLIGNGHNVDLTQSGSGSHNATISLTNGSAPSSLDLSQSGSTDQSYSLEQTCYTIGGCSATVTQN